MERHALPTQLVETWSAGVAQPGAHLGRYELLVPVGFGGMACVWAARLLGERGFSKLVAVKTILPHLAHNADFEKMLVDEARIAANVHHPNVCDLYELGEQDRVLYLAMEWVNGDSLVRVLRGGGGATTRALDPRIAARIVADVCSGLHAAHELTDDFGRALCVVHRDVSPHNILVSIDGAVKIADFGVAKARGQLHQTTNPGEVKGKAAYMAPEQIAGASIDRRADIFGLGCVLYEAITGNKPFRGDHELDLLGDVFRRSYELPKFVVPHASGLTAIVERALAARPDDRFQTAEEMKTALEKWLAASGHMVAAAQVADLLMQRLGPQIEERRERVRLAMCEPAGITRPLHRLQPASAIVPTSSFHSPPALPPPRPPPAHLGKGVGRGAQSAATAGRRWWTTLRNRRLAAAVVTGIIAIAVGRGAMGWWHHDSPPRVEVTVEPSTGARPQIDSKSAAMPVLDLTTPITPIESSSQRPSTSAPARVVVPVEQLPSHKPGSGPVAASTHATPARPPLRHDAIPANPY